MQQCATYVHMMMLTIAQGLDGALLVGLVGLDGSPFYNTNKQRRTVTQPNGCVGGGESKRSICVRAYNVSYTDGVICWK